jgi:hypothetical protein
MSESALKEKKAKGSKPVAAALIEQDTKIN